MLLSLYALLQLTLTQRAKTNEGLVLYNSLHGLTQTELKRAVSLILKGVWWAFRISKERKKLSQNDIFGIEFFKIAKSRPVKNQ